MKIAYNMHSQVWECMMENCYWGQNRQPIMYSMNLSTSILQFQLCEKRNELGPLIGILVGKNENNQFAGNGTFLRNFQEEIIKKRGISIVFSLEDIYDDCIEGFIYHPPTSRWYKVKTPLPQLIYNRITNKLVTTDMYQTLTHFCHQNHLPMLNPTILTLEQSYQLLFQSYALRNYLPSSRYVHSFSELISWIQKWKSILFIQPTSFQTKEIIYIELTLLNQLSVIRNGKLKIYKSIQEFELDYAYLFHHSPILIQHNEQTGEKIAVLYHWTSRGFQPLISNPNVVQQYKWKYNSLLLSLGQKTGQLLQKNFGLFLEYAIDFHVKDNKIFITALYTKPMFLSNPSYAKPIIDSILDMFYTITKYK